MTSTVPTFDQFRELWREAATRDDAPDPELTDLARLLADPRVPDAYAESVRAGLRETCYQLRAVAEGVAA